MWWIMDARFITGYSLPQLNMDLSHALPYTIKIYTCQVQPASQATPGAQITPITFTDLGFPPSDHDEEMLDDVVLEGIDINNLDPDSDEDLLDDKE
jgi:hypothetical protein